jgi:transcription elongation factor GreA
MKKIRFTKEGFENVKKEYEELIKQRPAIIEDLQKARELGDLKENGYYKASRQKLTFIDGRLFRLKMDMKLAEIVEESATTDINIGKTVTLTDGEKEMNYQIVGDLEANPSEGKISLLSPIGKALEGKKIDEEIHLNLPKGKVSYKILSIV